MSYEPQTGELFAERYRIDRLVGRGATGAVWAVYDEEVGDRVALKLLTGGPDDAAERFRREVRLARRVTHRNAARIFDLGAANGSLYLTMELVEGESLQALISRQARLSVRRAAEIGTQIAHGLAAAHEVGVVHRDIKPANVLLDQTGRVVLTDFGLARAVAAEANVTVGSVMMGTPSYMAPEQVRGEAVGPRTDLYALGALLYEMLTGRCPFVRDDAVAIALARLTADPEDPRRHVPMPDDVAALVMRCLERSSDRRPESATDVANVLAEIALRSETPDTAATLVATSAETAPGSYQGSRGSSVSTERASSSAARSSEQCTLAVLPFHHRGPAEHAHLAEVIAEDLVDVLTRTRGLRVTSSRATAKYLGQSVDPRSAGRELAVEAIVDGSVRILGDRVRISARLIDVATGEQLWTDRFDGLLAEAREIEEITPQRMADRLRQELELLGARHAVPLEAVDLYLEANRRIATAGWTGTDAAPTTLADGQVVDLLDRAIAIAPDFGLALAAHADFSVRRWFMPAGQNEETAKKAHESVARASVRAPQVPLTHYAAGRLAVSDGRFGDAARELTLALALAPTYAGVHAYLGSLQCEAGRGDEGERHIRLASRLDPALAVGTMLARHVAFDRDLARFRETIEELRAKQVESRFVLDLIEMRVGGWFGDLETVRRCRPSSHIQEHAANRVLDAQRAALLGESSEAQLLATLENALVPGSGPRLVAALRQLVVEGLAPMGAVESAMAQLRLLTDSPAFVDADWLERCPALDPLRSQADFVTIVARVRLRADAIWRVASST
ncbi:MAG TPA: protein kinase [Thermoanaerobaculia bacterium]|nr:protein kinase [Thermoanaerobaculia bacterium]